jgi:hypothetical protein
MDLLDPLLFNQVSIQLSSRSWVYLVPDLVLISTCGSVGNRTRDLMVSSQTSIHQNTYGQFTTVPQVLLTFPTGFSLNNYDKDNRY